jgi:hypothetical protein
MSKMSSRKLASNIAFHRTQPRAVRPHRVDEARLLRGSPRLGHHIGYCAPYKMSSAEHLHRPQICFFLQKFRCCARVEWPSHERDREPRGQNGEHREERSDQNTTTQHNRLAVANVLLALANASPTTSGTGFVQPRLSHATRTPHWKWQYGYVGHHARNAPHWVLVW